MRELKTAIVPPEPVRELAATLERAGHQAWCVGGAVRDALLGHTHLDWDLATSATPNEVRKVFRRTVPVGVEFGTVGVFDRDGRMHEVTTFRRDVRTDGRHAEVEFGASLDDDLARRDFTINAIAYSPSRGELRDPFGGRDDLKRGIVRAVGTPRERMKEDRLRALRGLRFAGRFGFTIENDTWRAISESASHLGRLSRERVKQEIEKTVDQVPAPGLTFRLWRDAGAFATLVPELARVSDVALSAIDAICAPGSAGDLAVATDRAKARADQRRLLRLALLFAELDPDDADRTLRALRFSNQQTAQIVQLLRTWHTLGAEITSSATADDRVPAPQIRRWASVAGRPAFALLIRMAAARWAAQQTRGLTAPTPKSARMLYKDGVRIAYRDPIAVADLAIDGDDLVAAGVAPGPALGQILTALRDAVLEDPSRNTRDELLALARQLNSR
ncbi:MAG TPA: CCA tRNA nucleotidyltransferase [Gemmatimonadaceae bacterium]|nr:CCA tRNA nucleotidyltransferase [Gemmatimonadaceae bacterium]